MKQHIKNITIPWLVYITYFLGVAFISGSIVHFPLNPRFYSIIAAIGISIFIFGAVMENRLKEQDSTSSSWVYVVISSLILSLGIGMLSGGIQHFVEVPSLAQVIIPLGVVLSIVGFVLKAKKATTVKEWQFVVVKIIVLTLPIYFLTHNLADSINHSGEDHHGHAEEITLGHQD